MFRNYLVTALRNFTRHRLYSFINLAGLAVGLACAIFIILVIRDELSYDSSVPHTENLYRMEMTYHFPGRPPEGTAGGIYPLAPLMKISIPEIQDITRLLHEPMTVKAGDRQFSEMPVAVDPNFFKVVSLPLVRGNPATVLANPESVVLSESVARKYFGDADAIGKTLLLRGTHLVTVTGIMRDLPHNTQLDAQIFFPMKSQAEDFQYKDEWFGGDTFIYVRLVPGADPQNVVSKTEALLDKAADMSVLMKMRVPAHQVIETHLTRFSDVHMNPFPFDVKPGGSWATVYGFGVIAVLILLIACFNFMNLATARAMLRAREVSMRKVVGAKRRQLVAQFLGESVLTALLALLIALAAVEILLPAFDGFLVRPITLSYAADWELILTLFGIAAFAGVLAGFYPALVISGFRPATTLKANSSGASGPGWLRISLVVLQFAISIGLGIAALTVHAQTRYAQNMSLGFDRDNIVVLRNADHLNDATRHSLTEALAKDPDIAGASQSSSAPFGEGGYSGGMLTIPGNPNQFDMRSIAADPAFFQVYNIPLLAGRYLTDRPADVTPPRDPNAKSIRYFNAVVNESAVKRFGLTPQNAIGKVLWGGLARVAIVGVVSDTKYRATRDTVEPIYYLNRPSLAQLISVRVKAGHTAEAVASIGHIWHQFAPSEAIDLHFLDDSFDKLFASDQEEAAMFGLFVGIAIFIACLGLFGLAAFTAERRTKEIGIRKTFGARTRDIIRLLLWQFSIPVLIANFVAWPVAYFYLHHWLEGFAYRVTLNPLYFIVAGGTALVIAWGTVLTHALRVARANPIHALRYE
ncbi:MAG TPA: ABC transporter permease [Rhizomicrobium sp.]|nr:ABC transporter permease [Rhizomicrobium sp.]